MATASVTYTFTNGTNADAIQVNQNFTDILTFINASLVQADNSVQLASNAVTTVKINDGAVTEGKLANSAVTSAKIADGTIVNGDINASAGIALSKLATGALPTSITIASANIVNGTIVAADIADDAVTNAKINSVSSSKISYSGVGRKRTTSVSIANNSWVSLAYGVSEFSGGSGIDYVSNAVELDVSGLVLFTASAQFASNTTGVRGIRLVDPDGIVIAQQVISAPTTIGATVVSCNRIVVNSGINFVYNVEVFQNSGAALNVEGEPTTFLQAVYLGG